MLGKKCLVKLYTYSSHIEGMGYAINMGEIANESCDFSINYSKIRNVYEDNISGNKGVVIEYVVDSIVVNNPPARIILLGITEPEKLVHTLLEIKNGMFQMLDL